jgi:hypothetical protein
LNGTSDNEKVGKITLKLGENEWYHKIKEASRHDYKGTEITKVHVEKERGRSKYFIYFGKKKDGYYQVTVQADD